MKTNKRFRAVILLILFIFSFEIGILSPNVFPQSIKRIEDKIGGGGTNTALQDSKNDNTFLYIAAGAIVVGLIVWKVFLDKKEAKIKDEIKTDSTKASLDKSFYKNLSEQELQLSKIQHQIPFEIIFGSQSNVKNIPQKNLSVGLRFKL